MEPRAQLHIKNILVFFFTAVVLLSVSGCFTDSVIPQSTGYLTVKDSDKKLGESKGIQYYDSLLFTGMILKMFDNGKLASETEYLNGKQNGFQKTYYFTGNLSEERYYENGMKTGEHKGWWENGNIKFEYHFKNDVFDGNIKMWNESGMLFNDFNYSRGHEDGLQKAWYPNGDLQANYVVKNNRKYGLTGVKNCKSVKDEINN